MNDAAPSGWCSATTAAWWAWWPCARAPALVQARRGVVLATGGFIFNKAMLAEHAPHLLQCNYPTGTPGDDGSGIRMGVGAGGDAINMGEGLVLNAYYPPAAI